MGLNVMFWAAPVAFSICAALVTYVLVKALGEAEESYAREYTADTARQFEDLFLFIPAEKMLRLSRIFAGVVFVGLFFMAGELDSKMGVISGVFAGGLGGLAALFAPRGLLKLLQLRRLEKFNNQLVNALTGMSNALKAGFSIQQAFEAIVNEGEKPIAQEFGVFLHQMRVGVKFDEALADMGARVGSDDLMLMIQTIEIARQTGGNLTEVLDRIAETIRERRKIEGKIKSLTAMGRIQGNVVGAMPLFLGLAMYLLDPEMMMQFIRSPIGVIILFVVLVMEFSGALMIRKIVNIDV